MFRRNAPIDSERIIQYRDTTIRPSLFKLTLTEALKEIATSISKQAMLNDEYAFNICLYDVHYINYSKIGLLGSIPEK